MYFYHPYMKVEGSGIKPPDLVSYLSTLVHSKITKLGMRLVDDYCVPSKYYNEINIEYSERYYGPTYNISAIFDANTVGNTVYYNPKNDNKIIVRITNVDNDKWIEIEELISPNGRDKISSSRTIHAILNVLNQKVIHVDGHINFYHMEVFKEMHMTGTSVKTDKHIKLWLVEGELSILEWANICRSYLSEYKLLNEIFKDELPK